jgi:WD40 repeat protein
MSLSFSPNGRSLAVLTVGGDVELWDMTTRHRQQVFHEHSAAIRAMAFSPDGQTLVSGGHDGALILWEVSSRLAPPS